MDTLLIQDALLLAPGALGAAGFPGLSDIGGILPAVVLLATGAVVLCVDLFGFRKDGAGAPQEKTILQFLSALGAVVAGAILCSSLGAGQTAPRSYFGGAIVTDGLSTAINLLVVLGTFLTFMGTGDALRRRGVERGEYHALILFAAASMVLFTQSSSLVMIFLTLETLSMAVYILTAFLRDDRRSLEGSLKYFILGALSSGFLLLGLVFLFGATRQHSLEGIAEVLALEPGQVDQPLLFLGMALSLVGLGFKVGAFPFHAWLPDAYEGAMGVVTGFMAVTVKAASFGVILRLVGLFRELGPSAPGAASLTGSLIAMLSALAVATMIFGNLVALLQRSVKRMLAYSAMAHTGYLLVGVVVSLSADEPTARAGAASVLFYLFPYGLMTIGAFACIAHLGRGAGEAELFEDYRGLARRRPGLALALLVLFVSFAGIPPTAGFWGKLSVFREALHAGHWGLALIGILTSVVSAYYYLGVVVSMYMREPVEGDLPTADLDPQRTGILVAALSAILVALVGLFPAVFLRLTAEWTL